MPCARQREGPWNAESQSQRHRPRLQHREVRRRVRARRCSGRACPPTSTRSSTSTTARRDDTLARLEKLAAAHPNVQVHTRPNSGWPGAPRNLGMKHAKGEYIQFVDHDDMLGPEALERLYEHAKRNDADVVLGKMSSTMVRPRRLFRHTVDACTIENDELMQSMSPHKMFRRAFVEEHGLRFPEGPWILEDLAFVSAAYLKAERISVLADYPCYYWMKRDDGGNNTQHRFNPRHGFWPNCRTIVRQIKDGTTPVRRRRRTPEPPPAPPLPRRDPLPDPRARDPPRGPGRAAAAVRGGPEVALEEFPRGRARRAPHRVPPARRHCSNAGTSTAR